MGFSLQHLSLDYTNAPPQDDPDPAVHPKQCSPVTIRRIRKSFGLKDLM
jgi:hypothetical protein